MNSIKAASEIHFQLTLKSKSRIGFRLMQFFKLAVIAFLMVGCASRQSQELKKVEVGMSKADVLGQVGNPTRNDRHNGMDRWTYDLQQEAITEPIYVYFDSGKVVYVGPSYPRGQTKSSSKANENNYRSVGDEPKL